ESRPIAAKPVGAWQRLMRWGAREPAKAGLLTMALVAVPTISALVALRIQDLPRLDAQRRAEAQARRDDILLLAQTDAEDGAHPRALAQFQAALDIDSESIEAITGLVMTQHKLGRNDEALRALEVHAKPLGDRRSAQWLRNTILRKSGKQAPAGEL